MWVVLTFESAELGHTKEQGLPKGIYNGSIMDECSPRDKKKTFNVTNGGAWDMESRICCRRRKTSLRESVLVKLTIDRFLLRRQEPVPPTMKKVEDTPVRRPSAPTLLVRPKARPQDRVEIINRPLYNTENHAATFAGGARATRKLHSRVPRISLINQGGICGSFGEPRVGRIL